MFQERIWKILDSYHLIFKEEEKLLFCIRLLSLICKILMWRNQLETKRSNNLFFTMYFEKSNANAPHFICIYIKLKIQQTI